MLRRTDLDPQDGARFAVPAAGEWRVGLQLRWNQDGKPRARHLPVQRGADIIQVEDTSAEQVFEIPVVPADLEQLLRSIER